MSPWGHSRRSDGQQGFADVRYAFDGDRIGASQRTVAMWQKATKCAAAKLMNSST
jgi:hypothetical protein